MQFVQPQPIRIAEPKQKIMAKPETKPEVKPEPISWSLGKVSVNDAVKASIEKNKSVRTEMLPAAKKTKTESVRTENLHFHKCQKCGTVFGHNETNHGNAAAHMCPVCGFGPNFKKEPQ